MKWFFFRLIFSGSPLSFDTLMTSPRNVSSANLIKVARSRVQDSGVSFTHEVENGNELAFSFEQRSKQRHQVRLSDDKYNNDMWFSSWRSTRTVMKLWVLENESLSFLWLQNWYVIYNSLRYVITFAHFLRHCMVVHIVTVLIHIDMKWLLNNYYYYVNYFIREIEKNGIESFAKKNLFFMCLNLFIWNQCTLYDNTSLVLSFIYYYFF